MKTHVLPTLFSGLALTMASSASHKLSIAGTSVAAVPETSAALLGGVGLLAMLRHRR